MSHRYSKIKFDEDNLTHEVEEYMYAHFNNTCDVVSVYNNNFDYLFSFSEHTTRDKYTQFCKLIDDWGSKEHDEVESWSKEDHQRFDNRSNNFKYTCISFKSESSDDYLFYSSARNLRKLSEELVDTYAEELINMNVVLVKSNLLTPSAFHKLFESLIKSIE